jgi:hypothetical protein
MQLLLDRHPGGCLPALLRKPPDLKPGALLKIDIEAGCFYHPQKKAAVHCSACGRFLCALCDVELNGRHFCMSCLESGKSQHKIRNLENERVLYDDIALMVAFFPLLIFYITIFTAPAALFIAIKHWKSPSSIIPRTKIRFVAAILLSVLQIAGWSYGIYYWLG